MCNNDRSALEDALANCVENAEEAPENPHHIGVVITRNGPCRVQTASKKALFCVDDGFTIKSGGTMIIPSAELLKIPAQSSAVTLCDTDHFNGKEFPLYGADFFKNMNGRSFEDFAPSAIELSPK